MALSSGAANQNATTSRILNKLNYALANIAEDISTATTSDIMLMLDASDNYELKYADATNIAELLNITVSEVNAAADALADTAVAVPDDTTYAVLAANTGKIHIMPDLTANCAIALPTAAAGLEYEFWYNGTAADAQNWVVTSTGAFLGGVTFMDLDTDVLAPVYSDGSDNTLTVVTPEVGTSIKVKCNGTNWYLNGVIASATVPTLTTV